MRFLHVQVENFRAIRRAAVEFGPGLNVLFGPNDLGKTTLATAMRAALLLPADSSAHQAFLPWQPGEPTSVSLGFEAQGSVWRIHKTFGSGSAATARLECSPDGSSFHEEARGRAVERRVRELLGWGIEAPGGKTGPRGLPESFLSHVLLAGQADAQQILEKSLGGDREDSGRQRLHHALSSLAQDPMFKRVLDAAQAKVDSAFTPKGKRRVGQGTPFAALREQINQLAQDFERFSHQRRESEEVQARVALLAEERLAARDRIAALEQSLAHGRAALLEREKQLAARQRQARAQERLAEESARQAELGELEASALAAEQQADEASAQAQASELAFQRREGELEGAEAAVAQHFGDAARAERAQHKAAFDAKREALSRRIARAEEVLELERQARDAALALGREGAELERADAALEKLGAELTAADRALEQVQRLAAFCSGREAWSAAERARAALADAAKLEALAAEAAARGERARGAARELAPLEPSIIAELRALEADRRLAAARLELGLTLDLWLAQGQRAEVALDGAAKVLLRGSSEPHSVQAKSRLHLDLGGGLELEVAAGAPELRAELERVERCWAERVAPLLARAQAQDVEQLAARAEQGRELERQAAVAQREAAELARRAEEKRALGADLELWTERARRLLEPFDAEASSELGRAAEALGSSKEKALVDGLARAEKERTRLASLAQAEGLRAAALRARRVELARCAEAARSDLERGLAEAEIGDVRELAGLLDRDRQELARASADFDEQERSLEAELARLERARDAAARQVREARARRDADEASSLAVRERHLELSSRLRERRLHFDPRALETARRELEDAAAELGRLPEVPEITRAEIEEEERELERLRAREGQHTAELRRAEGALGQIGGDVAADRERQTQEALERARQLEVDLERDYEGYRLLAETLREVENEQGVHLGRALERPVSERFDRLTSGRYGSVELDPELGLRGVLVAGAPRSHRELSEGTREQLATIVRLCIAEHLETAVVLDDHLAQTHRQRAEWFRGALRDAANRIQIIVLTARPEDLLAAHEIARALPGGSDSVDAVRAVDLEQLIERASYARRREVDPRDGRASVDQITP